MFFWVILYLVLGSTLFKVVSDINSIMKGTYVKKKTRQLLWKQVRKYRK